jgi:hypothetical protein
MGIVQYIELLPRFVEFALKLTNLHSLTAKVFPAYNRIILLNGMMSDVAFPEH